MAQSKKPKLSRQARVFRDPVWLSWDRSQAVQVGREDALDEARLFHTYEERRLLLTDLANLRDQGGVVSFWRRRNVRPEFTDALFTIQSQLRCIWNAPDSPDTDLILDSWLHWLPSPKHLKFWKQTRWATAGANEPKKYLPFGCSFRAGKLVPDLYSVRAMLIQGVFEHWRQFKYCANADCSAPYFIAGRKDQSVCDAEICKAEKQRQHALKWWKAHRAKNTPKQQAEKTTEKVGGKNVARKAR